MVNFRHANNPEPFTAYRKEREPAKEERFFPFEFEVWQGDEMVASASGPRDDALREAMHYAAQYEQDGPVRVFEVKRILVRPNCDRSACGDYSPGPCDNPACEAAKVGADKGEK